MEGTQTLVVVAVQGVVWVQMVPQVRLVTKKVVAQVAEQVTTWWVVPT
jgi:hypothetical protein